MPEKIKAFLTDAAVIIIAAIALILLSIFRFGCAPPAVAEAEVQSLDWFSEEAAPVLDRQTGVLCEGAEFTVVDVETGAKFQAVRKGGSNHMDFEPLTKVDTEVMQEISGGSWSWDRRAVWVVADGSVYAASINCTPHGSASVKNNGYPGHSCMHFTGSKTHGSNRVDEAHQAAVQTALETPFKEGSHG